MLPDFLSLKKTSLKICGVTTESDAKKLASLGVSALGFNFWPHSKRHLLPEAAAKISPPIAGKILRVGVFVNNAHPLASDLFQKNLIDIVQLHGDETEEDIHHFLDQNIPVIRAVSATKLPEYQLPKTNFALLIDTPAGSDYGGTGKTFDWSLAADLKKAHPKIPLLLAGGLTPENAPQALAKIKPAALDIASGAELSPGVKDFQKVQSLLKILSH